MTTDRDRGARRQLTERELERNLTSIEPEQRLRPPANLLAAIRGEIPEDLAGHGAANDGGVGKGGATAPWWQRHRLALADTFIVLAATGLMSSRLVRLASPERLAESAASSRPDGFADSSAPASASSRIAASPKREAAGETEVTMEASVEAPAEAAAGRAGVDEQPATVGTEQGAQDELETLGRLRALEASNAASEPAQDRDGNVAPAPVRQRLAGAGEPNEQAFAEAPAPPPRPDAAQAAGGQRREKASELSARVARGAPARAEAGKDDRLSGGEEIRAEPSASNVRAPALQKRSDAAGRELERAPAPQTAAASPRPPEAIEHDGMVAELRRQRVALESEMKAVNDARAPAPKKVPASEQANAEPAGRHSSVRPPSAVDPAPTAARPADVGSSFATGSFDAMKFRPAPTNPFVDPAEDPLSTFGLDVDTGSYTLARRYLDLDRLPPSESVRVEEYINFFDYGDPAPRRGDFALRLEAGPSFFAPDGTERLMLRVGVRARDVAERDRKPAALIFLVDVSGSMRRENRLELVKRSLELLVDELGPDDSVGLVVYGSTGRALLEPTRDHDAISQAIARLQPEGSTNLEDGLDIAYEMASRVRPRTSSRDLIRRVILCSDGVANVGVTDPESLLRGIADWAVRGVELTTVGFGMGNYNDELMERLADRGDGSYAYVDSLREARRIFVENLTGTLQTVAADARIQVELDPEVVASYRLLGYANRAIPDAAFRDERVDAGEIGAGHRVSALYEIELARGASRSAPLATARLRWRSKESGRTEEIEQSLETRRALGSWRSTPASLRLAQIVAGFAERLGRSPHTGASLDALFREAQDVLGEFPGRLDVAMLVTEIGEARDLEVMEGRR